MGALDLFAKQTFAEETAGVTRGAMAWEMPPELNLSEVRLDGMLLVRDAAALSGLAAPWSEASGHEQIAIENKMPGDHLGLKPLERALLRRQAWQVQRVETGKTAWRGQVPLWLLRTDDPEIRKRQRHVAEVIIDMNPDLREKWVEQGIERGAEKALSHQFERRLGRPLADEEHRALQERLVRLGSDRLGDVVFDLTPEALALWLADPGAA